jgi:hypothetical protein
MFTELICSRDAAPPSAQSSDGDLLRREFEQLVRLAVETRGDGCVIALFEGSALCAFADPDVSLARARQLHEEIARRNADQPAGEQLRVRTGVATAEVSIELEPGALARLAGRADRNADRAREDQIVVSPPAGGSRVSEPTVEVEASRLAAPVALERRALLRRRRAWRVVLAVVAFLAYLSLANYVAEQLAPRMKARRERLRQERLLPRPPALPENR